MIGLLSSSGGSLLVQTPRQQEALRSFLLHAQSDPDRRAEARGLGLFAANDNEQAKGRMNCDGAPITPCWREAGP